MLTITLVSLVVAATSGVVAWLAIRREQQRSSARVEALSRAIDRAPVASGSASPSALDDDFVCEPGTITFEALGPEPSIRHRLLTVVSAAAVVMAAVAWTVLMGDRAEPPAQLPVSPYAESLELLSLQASRTGSSLAVTGLVRSRTEEPLSTVIAVVSAIDAKGRPVARGSIPLAPILPRRETRFVVTMGDVNEATRYRVSFRSATGVIRHVDRRAGRASAVS